MRRCAALLPLIAATLVLMGATYYVRTDGSDSACSGLANVAAGVDDPNCAYATLNKATTNVSLACGDTIHVVAGTYTDSHTISSCSATNTGVAQVASFACDANTMLTIEGEMSSVIPAYDPAFEASHLSIFDGQNSTVTGLSISASQYVKVDKLAFLNFTGNSGSALGCSGFGTPTSDHIWVTRNVFDSQNTVPFAGTDSGWLHFAKPNANKGGYIADNLIKSNWTRVLSIHGNDSDNSEGTDVLGLAVERNWVELTAYGSLLDPKGRHLLDTRHLRNVNIRYNYIKNSSSDTFPASGGILAMYYSRENNDSLGSGYWRVYDNVFEGQTGGDTAGTYTLWIQDNTPGSNPCLNDTCNEHLEFFNNTIYLNRALTRTSNTGIKWTCNGCKAWNNAWISTVAGNKFAAYVGSGAAWDLVNTTTPSTIGYNYWSGISNTMVQPSVGLFCPSSQCNSGGTDADIAAGDHNKTEGSCIEASGSIPGQYYVPNQAPCSDGAATSTYCATLAPNGVCDIGAYLNLCGDSLLEPGEACDSTTFPGNDTCATYHGCLGSGGTLLCNAYCSSIITDSCNDCGPIPWSCRDGVKNNDETDVDCGGSTICQSCAAGKACVDNPDCASGVCTNNVCAAAPTNRNRMWRVRP